MILPPATIRILTAAVALPAAEARRIVAVMAKDAEPEAPDEFADLRAALSEDLRPIGAALWQASQAGDLAAVHGALKKISSQIPQLVKAEQFGASLAPLLAAAWIGESDQS